MGLVRSWIKAAAHTLLTRDDAIPDQCYALCSNAYFTAQEEGKSPALCEPGSAFVLIVDACNRCIAAKSSETTSKSRNLTGGDIDAFIKYCADTANLPITVVAVTITANVTISGSIVPVATFTTLASVQSFMLTGAPPSESTSSTSSTLTAAPPTSGQARPTVTPEPENHSKAWIAGPATGSAVGIVLVVLLFWFIRRHRRRSKQSSHYSDNPLEKPQLHSDCIPKPLPVEVETNERFELSGDGLGSAISPYEISGIPKKEGTVAALRSELEDFNSRPPELGSWEGYRNQIEDPESGERR